MSLPRSVICLKVHFLMQLEDMNQNFLHKDREAIQTPDMLVWKLQHYSMNVIYAISLVIFITELLILAAFCFHCWNSIKIEKPYERARCLCEKRLKHYLPNVIHTIPSIMSGFITELLLSTTYCNFCFHR